MSARLRFYPEYVSPVPRQRLQKQVVELIQDRKLKLGSLQEGEALPAF